MSFWEKNVQALQKQQSFFREKLEDIDRDCLDFTGVREEKARDGNAILVIQKDGRDYVMNSRFRPVSEAVSYAAQFESIKDYSVCLFMGFGNGTFAREIIKKGSDAVRYAFYEPCREAFLFALINYDLSDVLASDKVTVYVEGINDRELAAYLPELIDWTNIPLTDIYLLPKYKEMYPEAYVKFVKMARDVIARAQMGMNTIVAYAHQRLYNSIHHLRFAFEGTSAKAFINAFPKELPAILVSAGPSLSNNIEQLKQAKNRTFILCVDTALRRLMAEGIEPDAVIGVDPVKWAAYQEEFVPHYQNMMWITESCANVAITKAVHSYRNVFIDGEDELNNHLFEQFGLPLPQLATGGSVANTGFSLLESWGFDTIILMGQDLALTGNRRYSDQEGDAAQQSLDKGFTLFETEGYYGGTVTTREDYFTYLKWFEGAFSISSVSHIINATEGGAMIHGAENMTLRKALDTYAQKEYSVRDCIDQVPRAFTEEQKEELDQQLRNLPARVNYFIRLFKEGKNLAERAMTLSTRENPNQRELMEIQKRLEKIDESTRDELEFIAISDRACKTERTIVREQLTMSCEEQDTNVSVLKGIIGLYDGFLEAAIDMRQCAEEMMKELDEEGWR